MEGDETDSQSGRTRSLSQVHEEEHQSCEKSCQRRSSQPIIPTSPLPASASSSLTTMAPSSSSPSSPPDASTRWSLAIRKILEESKKQKEADEQIQEEAKGRDVVGEEMARILNGHSGFEPQRRRKRPRTTNDEIGQSYDEGGFQPLLSSHNLGRIRTALQTPKESSRMLWEFIKEYGSLRQRGTARQGFNCLGILLVGSAVLLGYLGTVVVVECSRFIAVLVPIFLVMTVDLEEIWRACPQWLKTILEGCVIFMRTLDQHMFLGRRTLGREWDASGEYVFAESSSSGVFDRHAVHFTLLDRPPPCMQSSNQWGSSTLSSGGQDQDWSLESRNHLCAIHFVHKMLHNDHLRRQRKKKQLQNRQQLQGRQRLIKGSSMSELDTSTPTKAKRRNLLERHSFSTSELDTLQEDVMKESPPLRPIQSKPRQLEDTVMETKKHSPSSVDSGSQQEKKGDVLSFKTDSSKGEEDDGQFSLSTVEEEITIREVLSPDDSVRIVSPIPAERAGDMNWIDVGATIGMRLLNSENVRRAVASQDTAERFRSIGRTVEQNFGTPRDHGATTKESSLTRRDEILETPRLANLSAPFLPETSGSSRSASPILLRPVHKMWTSASAIARQASSGSIVEDKDSSSSHIPMSPEVPMVRRRPGAEAYLSPTGSVTPHRKWSDHSTLSPPSQTTRFSNKWSLNDPTEEKKSEHMELVGPGQSLETQRRDSSIDPNAADVILNQNPSDLTLDSPKLASSLISSKSSGSFWSPTGGDISISRPKNQRAKLQVGVKVAVPIFPIQPGSKRTSAHRHGSLYQMGTVIHCKRIFLRGHVSSSTATSPSSAAAAKSWSPKRGWRHTNCLSIKVTLDKSFLRGGKFASMTLRIPDDWPDRYMPKHSKFPVGACVATTFGLGVLVFWRVEDDCHVVRSLWNRRGAGSGHAYLSRDALHGVVEAAPGFKVETTLGKGMVLAYVRGGKDFLHGRYFVRITQQGRHKDHALEFHRSDILSCRGPNFIPLLELIREAADYQIQLDNYEAALRKGRWNSQSLDETTWNDFSKGFDIIWSSFLKAMEEDEEIDNGVNKFFASIISFLERLDNPEAHIESEDESKETVVISHSDSDESEEENTNKYWLLDGFFGDMFQTAQDEGTEISPSFSSVETELVEKRAPETDFYKEAFAVIRGLMKMVSLARSAAVDQPELRLSLAVFYEFLLFSRTVLRVQKKNISPASMAVWKRAIDEISATFGPLKERLEKIGKGITERVEKHGSRAKVRLLKFVDILLADEKLMFALERGDWYVCLNCVEEAFVKSEIVDADSRVHYHNTVKFLMDHVAFPSSLGASGGAAAKRNNEKLVQFAKFMKMMASPRRSLLKLIRSDQVLELLERVLVRVFRNEPEASRMITIHAFNMRTLRHLRMLKDFTISGSLWMPILEAANDEFSWTVTQMPESTKDIMLPLSKLFSLGVSQFRRIYEGDLTADWLDFLLEDEAVALVHEIDLKLILSVEAFSKDVKEVMVILPYYPSIDDDILNLMDEVNFDEFLREASEALLDAEKLANFIREKSTLAIERFLDYLPKMSIPVERRELGEGWALTCRGEDGGDLQLSDVTIKRENLTCQVLGGDTLFFPMFDDNESEAGGTYGTVEFRNNGEKGTPTDLEISVLDQVRELLMNAERHGAWQKGVGGVGQPPSDPYVAEVLRGLPVSNVLNTGIELWRDLEIDDDELLEIAIKDVSYQIQLQKDREDDSEDEGTEVPASHHRDRTHSADYSTGRPSSSIPWKRFNPRVDPTVLYLEMRKLTLNLSRFAFRIEPIERRLFDPVFEGFGSLSIENMSIKLRVECKKERVLKLGNELTVPVLQLQEISVVLERVKITVNETGADWFLNRAVTQFSEEITSTLQSNLEEQVQHQMQTALENLNTYFVVNPDLMLGLLGITMDDLEENVVWV